MDKKAFVWGDPRPEGPSGIQDDPPPGHTSPYEFDFPYGGQSPDRVDNTSAEDDLKHLWDKKPAGGKMTDDVENVKAVIKKILENRKPVSASASGGIEMKFIDESLKAKILNKIAAASEEIKPGDEGLIEQSISHSDVANIAGKNGILVALGKIFLKMQDRGLYKKDELGSWEDTGFRQHILNIANQPELYASEDIRIMSESGSGLMKPKEIFEKYRHLVVKAINDVPKEVDKNGPAYLISKAREIVESWGSSAADVADETGEEKAAPKVKYDPKFSANLEETWKAWNELTRAIEAAERQKKFLDVPMLGMRAARAMYKKSFMDILQLPDNIHVVCQSWYRGVINNLRMKWGPKWIYSINGLESAWKVIHSSAIMEAAVLGDKRKSMKVNVGKDQKYPLMVTPASPNEEPVMLSAEEVKEILEKIGREQGTEIASAKEIEYITNKFRRAAERSKALADQADTEAPIVHKRLQAVQLSGDKFKGLVDDAEKKVRQMLQMGELSDAERARLSKPLERGNTIGDITGLADSLQEILGDPAWSHMTGRKTREPSMDFFGRTKSEIVSSITRKAQAEELQALIAPLQAARAEFEGLKADFESYIDGVVGKMVAGATELLEESKELEEGLAQMSGKKVSEEAAESDGNWFSQVIDKAREYMPSRQEPAMATAAMVEWIERTAAEEGEKGRPMSVHTENVPRSGYTAMRQFIMRLFGQADQEYTGPMPEGMKGQKMTGMAILDKAWKAGRAAVTRLFNDTNIWLPKILERFAQGVEKGDIPLGVPHDKIRDEHLLKYQSYYEVAKRLNMTLAELHKRLAQEQAALSGKLGMPGQQIPSGTGESFYTNPEKPLEGLESANPERDVKVPVEKIADDFLSVLRSKEAQKNKSVYNLRIRMGNALMIVADYVRQKRAEAIKASYGEGSMSDEDRKIVEELEGKPTQMKLSLAPKTDVSIQVQDAKNIAEELRKMKSANEEAKARGMSEFSDQEAAEYQALLDKEEQLAGSGQKLSDEEQKRKEMLSQKMTMATRRQVEDVQPPDEYRGYALDPELVRARKTNYDILIDAFDKLADLAEKVKSGDMESSAKEYEARLKDIDKVIKSMENDPEFRKAINLVEVQGNPLLREIYESFSPEGKANWKEIEEARGLKPLPKKKMSKSALENLFRAGGVEDAGLDPKFTEAVAEAESAMMELEAELGELAQATERVDMVMDNPEMIAKASKEDVIIRKADRIAGSDMYKEYDLSPNAWALVDGVDGAKKLMIDKKTRVDVKNKLSNSAAFQNGAKVAVDFDDAIHDGTVVAHLGGSMYKVKVQGHEWDVDGSRIFRI